MWSKNSFSTGSLNEDDGDRTTLTGFTSLVSARSLSDAVDNYESDNIITNPQLESVKSSSGIILPPLDFQKLKICPHVAPQTQCEDNSSIINSSTSINSGPPLSGEGDSNPEVEDSRVFLTSIPPETLIDEYASISLDSSLFGTSKSPENKLPMEKTKSNDSMSKIPMDVLNRKYENFILEATEQPKKKAGQRDWFCVPDKNVFILPTG